MSAVPAANRPRAGRLPRNVIALGVVSFLTDASTEMIYPLVPVFLAGVLGSNARFIGAIEGTSDTVSSLVRLASGWWSDRIARRKPLVLMGYGLAGAARPLIALAQSAGQVLAIRVVDRVGKGIRTAPRDALLADSAHHTARGRSFGFHHAADSAGAVMGPVIGFGVLWWLGVRGFGAELLIPAHERALRTVFWVAAIPALLAFLVLLFAVREIRPTTPHDELDASGALRQPFWRYLAIVLVFTLANSTDAFLLLRAHELGVAVVYAPLLWALLNMVKTLGSTAGGALSDRAGRRGVIASGWLVYAFVYAAFAGASAAWQAWTLFALYGVFYSLAEGPQRAFVADLVPSARRGAAYGWYSVTIALGALPASLLFGWAWDRFGPRVPFGIAAILAVIAAGALMSALPRVETQATRT